MRKPRKKRDIRQDSNSLTQVFMVIIKGSLLAILITLVCILIAAFVWQFTDLKESVMKPVVQGVRILSIAIGGAFAARLSTAKGWLKGAAAGLGYIVFATIISVMSGVPFTMDTIFLSDVITAFVVGAIGGAIGINLG